MLDLGPPLRLGLLDFALGLVYRNDGSIFQNRASDLPQKRAGYYIEYVHPTPGIVGPGPQRIVVGKGGEMYYTADHKTFIQIKIGGLSKMLPFKFVDIPPSYDAAEVFYVRIDPSIGVAEELIRALYYLLWLPGYFGFNWDALYDCLRDLSWIPCHKIVLCM
ncbi:barstar family protein [Pseudomonas guariconensis]|uniref:barstar family protein n=1 Tax=Pseudomonas guariconensis TaxID=1288410 RepID=UPI003A7F2A01